MSKDPVCGMAVDEKTPLQSMHAKQAYSFCSATCQKEFDKEPGRYATPAGEKNGKRGTCCA